MAVWLGGAAVAVAAILAAPSCTLDSMGLLPAGAVDAGGGAGGSSGIACTSAPECPGATTDCQRPNCVDGECGTFFEPTGKTCSMDGGSYCNGRGDCVECTDGSHCPGATEICDTTTWECIPTTCDDGQENGGESDVDCGGPCPGCTNGQECNDDADCASRFCNGSYCSACSDHPQCPDGYCDTVAGVCEEAKSNGDGCDDPIQCQSGFCPAADGVCCDAECAAECVGCTSAKTGGADGTCAPIAAGEDYDGECDDAPPCGTTGLCNGNATSPGCAFYPSSTTCGPAQSCAGGIVTLQDTCDGAGTCTDAGTLSCNGLRCDGADCRTSCTDHSHCLGAYWCDIDSTCQADKSLGAGCADDRECLSGHCADGVCCDSACTGPCLACNGSGSCQGYDCNCIDQYDFIANNYEECAQASDSCEFYEYRSGGFDCAWLCRQVGGECIDAWNDAASHCERAASSAGCTSGLSGQICLCSRGCGSGPRCPPGQTCSSGSCS